YLAEFLLSKGYHVHGIIRRSSSLNTQRIDAITIDPQNSDARLSLHYGDLSDPGILSELIWKIKPDEIYNLAAQSHVKVSFDMPEYTGNITGLGTTRLLEAIRRSEITTKFYQASSSEMFGSQPAPQNEQTPFCPRSPYAAAKLYAYWMTINYREAYGLFACNGILFNHESPRRGENFLTRKITYAIAQMLLGKQKKLVVGNLDTYRDWGFAPEFVEMMWHILQQATADDYVVGTGKSHSVRSFIEKAFAYAGLTIEWFGQGIAEKGIVASCHQRWKNIIAPGACIVEIDPCYFRPTEVNHLQADPSKIQNALGWTPRISFDELIAIMVDHDLLFANIKPIGGGLRICQEKNFLYTAHHNVLGGVKASSCRP
ncbi:MAG: GDP-mannose 4,6-dehydratase, partial [Candidatus Babeliales bacterium]